MKPNIYIRADGSSQIGLGHLVRCSALAKMLQGDFSISFFCKEIPESFEKELKGHGFGFTRIENENNFIDQLNDRLIVVLDGYHFDTGYQMLIKAKGCKLVCIDDLHDKEFVADLIINHAPEIKPENYNAKPYTQFALGLDFALLRPAFWQQASRPRKIEKIETVLICFGGSDFNNLTQISLEVVLTFSQIRKIIVVLGPSYQSSQDFHKLVSKNPKIDCRYNLDEYQMLAAMLEAEIAIVPASGILFETLAAKCLVITSPVVDNQKYLYEGFLGLGCIIGLSIFSRENLQLNLKSLLKNTLPDFYWPIGGEIKTNLRQVFNQLFYKLKTVTTNDAAELFEWVNDPSVRIYSFKKEPIMWDEHLAWLTKNLASNKCKIFILTDGIENYGQIRFDFNSDNWAMIDYSIAKRHRGKGLGKLIIQLGIEQIKGITMKIKARVDTDNIVSNKIFESLGFIKQKINTQGPSYNEFSKQFNQ